MHQKTLSTLGAPISDELFAIIVSASLLDSWDSFMRSYFGNKGKVTVTLQELIGLVVDEVKRLTMKEKEMDIANQTRPFNNNRRPIYNNSNASTMRPNCQNCGRGGHNKSECWA